MSAAKTVIFNARVLLDGELQPNSWLVFEKTIFATGQGQSWEAHIEGAKVIDADNQIVSAGLIDTHVHGGGGFAAEDGEAGMRGLINFHKSQGTANLIMSLVSNPLPEMLKLIDMAKKVALTEPALIGVHLEGPFLSAKHKGAHDPSALALPTVEALQNLIAVGGGLVKSITMAPELFSSECIEVLTKAHVVICVGHTDADFDTASEAFATYATVLTHAFNGMNPIHHRAPGPVVAAMNTKGAWLELIADGVHVDESVGKIIEPDKLILVTDAMIATGQPDGDYTLGALPVTVQQGIARTKSGSIAGSTLTMPVAVANYARWVGSPQAALMAATANPAKAYGLVGIGSLKVGNKAQVILWAPELVPQQIW